MINFIRVHLRPTDWTVGAVYLPRQHITCLFLGPLHAMVAWAAPTAS
jgi:hypothetical protein